MLISHLILAIAWIVYCVLHSLLAATGIKQRIQKTMKRSFRFYRLGYTIFSFAGLVAILIYQFTIESTLLFIPSILTKTIAAFLMAAGGIVVIMMIRKYFVQMSGIRWLTAERIQSKLEVSGLHRYVRHPLYLGTFVFIWGWFLLSPSLTFLISNCIITIYTLIGLHFEEEKLIREFGDEYIQYKKKVPRLIPKF
jgi:methanethiol S-methyltransferase